MTEIRAVVPPESASDPSHPEHSRWVKEKTLAMEVHQATASGGSLRTAEDANITSLARLAMRRSGPAKKRKNKKRREFAHREITKTELADAGVTRKPASPILTPPPIAPADRAWAFRIARIMELGRQGDKRAVLLALEVVAIKMAVSARRDYKDAVGRELPFSRLRGASVHRAVRAGMEWVCERSIPLLGVWR